jgi:lipopolysaccharide transport system ATP-binding protein
MSSRSSISIEQISKCYHIYDKPQDRLKQAFVPKLQRSIGRAESKYFREFWAVKNVSFEIQKGQTVGIIGKNGSGKSTLLQMICGTLTPTAGTIRTHGRLAALLELGSGFNADFSGRDNVFMNAALLGLERHEIENRFDDIVAFADIGAFIDEPVKTYSSGMMVRLAFAVQSQVDPEILIVDEALAVGDARFQSKCFDRLKKLKDQGTSILLVTHSSEQIVTHCDSAILLHEGQVIAEGEPKKVTNKYLDLLFGKNPEKFNHIDEGDEESPVEDTSGQTNKDDISEESDKLAADMSIGSDVFHQRPNYNPHEYRWGDGGARINDFQLIANGALYPSVIPNGATAVIQLSVEFQKDLHRPILGITIKTKEGITVCGVNSESLADSAIENSGQMNTRLIGRISFNCRLAPGDYFISVGVATRVGDDIVPHDRRYDSIYFQVSADSSFYGLVDLDMSLSTANQ